MPKIHKLTALENGYVKVKEKGAYCEFRCLYPKDDFNFNSGNWLQISQKPDCDVVEVQCKRKANEGPFDYNDLHIQVYKNSTLKLDLL